MQIGRIRQLSRPEDVLQRKEGASDETKDADPDEHGRHVRIPAAKDARRAQDQRLAAAEFRHDVIGVNGEGQDGAFGDGLIDPAVEFAKGRLRRNAHPHNEMLIQDAFNRRDHVGVRLI